MFITLKQKQHNSAMESGDHSKNGVSPKNQMSRGFFLMSGTGVDVKLI